METPGRGGTPGRGVVRGGGVPRTKFQIQQDCGEYPMEPTREQRDAIDAFTTGGSTKVNAYAGTGKTSSLTMLARATDRVGVYMAFNKAIAEDAKRKFPGTVRCQTTHAMAFSAMARRYQVPKMTGNLNGGIIARRLNLRDWGVGANIVMSGRGIGWMIAQTLQRFMRSDRDQISLRDVPRPPSLDVLTEEQFRELQGRIYPIAVQVWEQVIDPQSDMPMSHDGYLKAWALGRPMIPGEFIFVDEAQDTNGVVLGILRHQRAQLVFVGDARQALYEWRGAINAMETFETAHGTRLTKSWRFGPEIAREGSRALLLLGETVPLTGDDKQPGRICDIEKPDVILARTNARCVQEVLDEMDAGGRPVVVGGVAPLVAFCDGAEKLLMGIPSDHEDLIGFTTWKQVVDLSQKDEGQDLRVMVNLIEKHGAAKLKRQLNALPKDERDGTVIISTGHKSKGREWGKVRLCDDFLRGFREPEPDKKVRAHIDPSELRLYYVACTRARKELEIAPDLVRKIRLLEADSAHKAAASAKVAA